MKFIKGIRIKDVSTLRSGDTVLVFDPPCGDYWMFEFKGWKNPNSIKVEINDYILGHTREASFSLSESCYKYYRVEVINPRHFWGTTHPWDHFSNPLTFKEKFIRNMG